MHQLLHRIVKLLKILSIAFLSIFVIAISGYIFFNGWEPVGGDTYSEPGTNILASMVILGVAYAAWALRPRNKNPEHPDPFAKWLEEKTKKPGSKDSIDPT